jgi:cytochrome c553
MKSSTYLMNALRSARRNGSTAMSMKTTRVAVALLLGAAAAGCANVERSRDLGNPNVAPEVTAVQVCSACHGVTGNSVSPNFPRLAGQQPDYIEEQLKNFRSHQRADPEGFEYMWGISRKLTDEQIKGLASYFAKQTSLPNTYSLTAANTRRLAEGKTIFEAGVPSKETPPCQACHGPKGERMAAFPRLADQHQDYLVKQLLVFRDTEGRPGTPMKQVTHNLTPEEIYSVTAYLQTLPR